MSKELFGKPLKFEDNKNKKEEENRKIRRGFELYTIYFFHKYTGWQTSHPPPLLPLEYSYPK